MLKLFFKCHCNFIWYFHSNVTILCLKSNKMRHHRNKECTTANRSKYERTQAGGSLYTYQTSLHRHMHIYMVISLHCSINMPQK